MIRGILGLLIIWTVLFCAPILWITFHDGYVHAQQQKADEAQLAADCIAHPPTNDIDRFLCGPLGRH